MKSNIRKAVSLVFLFENSVFSIVRQNYLKAFPGYTSFPGGKVDHSDQGDSLEDTLMNTIIREGSEELNINIPSAIESGAITDIRQFAKATSPDFNPHRYEVYFYLIKCNAHLTFDVDESEAREFSWLSASKVVGDYYQGKNLMVKPVLDVYKMIAKEGVNVEFLDFDQTREVYDIPRIENIHGVVQLMPESNTVPPASRTNCFLIGDVEKIVIDPSPKNKVEYDNLCKVLGLFNIQQIFITHHHKDHHQFAADIARKFELPILISQDSFERINRLYGDDYFFEITVNIIREGDVIGQWLKRDLVIHEIPGHDEGHLGLAPDTLDWFIVGDLFQGVGTVVVGGDEGDMHKYMRSLEKVINLAPGSVIPSHGIPLGGTSILERTYKHREMREEQILDLFNKGYDLDRILTTIYFDIPEKILKYAKANIQSHLDKLKIDKKI